MEEEEIREISVMLVARRVEDERKEKAVRRLQGWVVGNWDI